MAKSKGDSMTRISRWACACCLSKQLPLQSASRKIHIWCETPPLTLALVCLQIHATISTRLFNLKKALVKLLPLAVCVACWVRDFSTVWHVEGRVVTLDLFSFPPPSEDCSLHTFDASILAKQWPASRWAIGAISDFGYGIKRLPQSRKFQLEHQDY